MRKFLLSFSVILGCMTTQAQTVADFETPKLPKADTAYINYTKLGEDVGFSGGLAYFPCVYDTSFGYEYWDYGFAYSNMTDSVTSGFMNQYSAKTAKGFAGSEQYVVASGMENIIRLTGAASGKPVNGFYITNSTYAYNSMRDGDGFAKKFSAADSDFFRLDIFGVRGDTLSKDSVSFYLADFRFTDTTKNYIVRDWQWVDLNKLGKADSLYFRLSSSDTAFGFINTPLYFCMDNFMTNETSVSVKDITAKADLKVYPNPANNFIFVESALAATQTVTVSDLTGRILASYEMNNQKLEINTGSLTPGTYMLNFRNGSQVSTTRFIKQ